MTPLILLYAIAELPLKPGRAPYAIQNTNYNCDAFINSLTTSKPKEIRYAWLYHTFNNHPSGDGLDCVRKINALPNTSIMQVHLINEVCQRNRNCGDYELLHGIGLKEFREGLKKRDQAIIAKVDNYIKKSAEEILSTLKENTTCLVSPSLESNLDQQAAKVLIEITKKHFGERCKIVWNPVGNNKYGIKPIEGTIHELHGAHPKLKAPCVADLDGVDINLPERKSFHRLGAISISSAKKFLKNYSHCEASFLWIAEDNCIGPGGFKDPRSRTGCTDARLQAEVFKIFGE